MEGGGGERETAGRNNGNTQDHGGDGFHCAKRDVSQRVMIRLSINTYIK